MNFVKKNGCFTRALGFVLAIALVLTGMPLIYNTISVEGAEVGAYNLITNGSFEDDFSGWSGNLSGLSVVDASAEGLTAVEGQKITRVSINDGDRWANRSQTVTVTPDTDYLFSMWVYQPDTNSKLILKIGTPDSQSTHTAFCPDGNEYQIWGKHKTYGEWFKITIPFNSGSNTSFIMHLVLSGGVIYVDNISLKKSVNVTAEAENGTVSGLPSTVEQGDKLTVTAVPNEGYAFSGWYENDVCVADTASYTFYAVEDIVLRAKFELTNNLIVDGGFDSAELCTKWSNSYNRGIITADEKYSGERSLFIQKQSGYGFLYYWPIEVKNNTKYRITMKVKIPTDAECPIIKVLDNGGSGNSLLDQANSSGNTWLNSGNDAIAAGCDWQEAYFTFNSGENTQVSMLFTGGTNAAAYIDDISMIEYYSISATAKEGGTVSGIAQNWAYVDTPIALIAEANAGYRFDGWYENGIKISSDSELKFNLTADRVLTANFAELDNYITDGGFELDNLHGNWVNPWNRLSVTQEAAYEGEQALHLAKTDLESYSYGQYLIAVETDTDYMIKMMVKVPTGSEIPLLQVLGEDNTHLINERDMSNNNFFINGGDDSAAGKGWFSVTATFNSGDNTSVKLSLTGSSNAEAYIDELKVGEAFTATITAGENGSVPSTTVLGLKNDITPITAVPYDNYMVEGWYIDGVKVSERKTYNHLFTEDIALEVKFTESTLPVMTDFDLSALWCAEGDNLLSDSSFENGTGEWNTVSFIKDSVLDVIELDGQNVLYFNPDGMGRQVMYFPVTLESNTEYMFSAKVRGKYYSDTNHMDMSFGIMNTDSEYIMLESYATSGYYDETPNVTATKSITPPSWDNNWHRRGITFKTLDSATVWIAVSGNISEAYLDDFMLCKLENAIENSISKNIASVTNSEIDEDETGCADSDNLVENYKFDNGETGWDDGYGWKGLYSGICIGNSGNGNKSLLMRSTTGRADNHYYIKWIAVEPNTEYTLSLASAATTSEAHYGLLVEGIKRYSKLVSWTADGSSQWVYNAVSFNSNDSNRVGVFVMDAGGTTALDDIRLFETSKATALTDKLSGKAVIPVEDDVTSANNYVKNGSFEENYDCGWSTSYTTDFSNVDANGEAPVTAIDGSKILKVSATGEWYALNQNLNLEANKEYAVSFWYYRVNDGYISLKFGNSTADNGLVKEDWLNTEAKNQWVYKEWIINTTDDTTVKLFLCAFDGTAYIDDVRIVATEDMGNLIQNGDMSNAGKAIDAWSATNSELFTYDATAEGYTGTGALKITGDGVDNWYNMTYTVKVKSNTDYVFRFYAKNSVAGDKMIYKVLDSNGVSFIGGDKFTNGDGTSGNGSGWGKNEWCINTGDSTTVKIHFVERSNSTSYIDDIYFGAVADIPVSLNNEALGNITADKAYAVKGEEVTYTAVAAEGGNFLGWRVGNSEKLIVNKNYTYNGFDADTVTAVFEAKLGNINEDSSINVLDLADLRGILMETEDYVALGDMNVDAVLDARDIVKLKKLIAYML